MSNEVTLNVSIKTVFKEVYKFLEFSTDSLAGKETLMYLTVYPVGKSP